MAKDRVAMTRLSSLVAVGLLYLALSIVARDTPVGDRNKKRHEVVQRWQLSARAPPPPSPRVQNISFSNPIASRV